MIERENLKLNEKMQKNGVQLHTLSQLFKTKSITTYDEKVALGKYFDYNTSKEKIYYIDFNATEGQRILVLGSSGSGKTWIVRALMNRAYVGGILPIIMTDIQPEYYVSKYPLQEEFTKFLLPIESPTSLPMNLYYPYFLHKSTGFELPDQRIFQLNLSKISPSDITSFIPYSKLSLSAKTELDTLVASMTNMKSKPKTINEMLSFFKKRKMKNITKEFLKKSLRNMKKHGIFGTEAHQLDLMDDINKNIVPNFNLFGWQSEPYYKQYLAIYMALILRDILVAKQLHKISLKKKLLLVFEELHEFAPKKPEGDFKDAIKFFKSEIIKATLEGRKNGISFIYATQYPESISSFIIKQCTYVLVPKGFDVNVVKEIIKNLSPSSYSNPYKFNIDISKEMGCLRKYKDGSREWLVIKRGGGMTRVRPLAPLSHHKVAGDII